MCYHSQFQLFYESILILLLPCWFKLEVAISNIMAMFVCIEHVGVKYLASG